MESISFRDLMRKEVICLQSGRKVGFAEDMILDAQNAKVISLTVQPPRRFWAEGTAVTVEWSELRLIGEDTVLVGKVEQLRQAQPDDGIKKRFERLRAIFKKDG